MLINFNSWHAKLYLWTKDRMFIFAHNCERKDSRMYDQNYRDMSAINTNLCDYIRTLTILLPLYIGLNVLLLAFAAYVLLYYPFTFFGYISVFKSLAILSCIIAACVAVGFSVYYACKGIKYTATRYKSYRVRYREQNPIDESKIGLFKLMMQYIKDKHSNICSMIVIKKDSV